MAQIFRRRGTDVGARQSACTNNAVESFHAALRRRVKVTRTNLYTFLGHLQRATADGETNIARLNRGMSVRYVVQRNAPTWSTKHASRFAFPVLTAARTHACSFCAQWVTVWAHTLSPKMVPQIQTQRTTTKSATTATATSLSQLSVNRSRRTYARCVWCSSATHDLLSCRAGTSVSALPASLSLNNKLAVAQYAALTSAWSCICTSGSEMLLKLTMYCLRTIRTVFCHCVLHFFLFILITMMIILRHMFVHSFYFRQLRSLKFREIGP